MFAEATLKGLVDERIWRYDNTTYFRLKVAGARHAKRDGLFTVALPKNVSRSMPRPLRAGCLCFGVRHAAFARDRRNAGDVHQERHVASRRS